MKERLVSLKVPPATLRLAKLAAATADEKIYEFTVRAVAAEARRMGVGMPEPPVAKPIRKKKGGTSSA